jgi:hypothetical protein
MQRTTADQQALLVVAGAVLVANLLYLLGVFDPNPLGTSSALASGITPGLLPGTHVLDPNIGFTSQALGHRAAVDWLHLQLPWWNPYEATGVPLAGEMQSAALFPPTLLLAFANGQIYEHVLLELVAACSTYLLLRRVDVLRPAAIAGAIAFGLNGTFAWFAHAAVNPIAFLPLLLLGLELAYDAARRGRHGGWWLIAVAAALSLYAGFPETAYLDGLLAVLWFGWRCRCGGRALLRPFATKVLAAVGTAVLLAAPILVAFLRYLQSAFVGSHSGAENVHLPIQALPQLLLPYLYGPIDGYHDPAGMLTTIWGQVGGYLTTSLVLFGLIGLRARGRRGLGGLLAAWIVLSVARIYGVPVVGKVLGVLPGMSSVQFFRLSNTSLSMAVIVLAAFGLDSIGRSVASHRLVLRCGGMTLALIALAAIGGHGLADRLVAPGPGAGFALSVLGGAAVVVAGTAAAILIDDPGRRLCAACAVLAADVLVMFIVPQLSAPRSVTTDTSAVTYLQRHLGTGRFFTLGPLQPNYGSYFRVASLNNNDLPLPNNWVNFLHANLDPYVDVFHFVGNGNGGRSPTAPSTTAELLDKVQGYQLSAVRYVLTGPGTALPFPLQRVLTTRVAWVYELRGAASFYSAPGCAVSSHGIDAVSLDCPRTTVLLRRETYMPGWTAAVDGRSTSLRQAPDGLFQTVTVPAGRHRVTFSFAPPGIGLAGIAFLLGAGGLGAGIRRGRRQPLEVPEQGPDLFVPPPAAGEAGPPQPTGIPIPMGGDAPDAAPTPVIAGRVEAVGGGAVVGWAWCPDEPTAGVVVRTMLDGRLSGSTVADLPRPSLVSAGIGDGNHGFRIRLPVGPAGPGPHTLRVEAHGIALPPAASFNGTVDAAGDPWSGAEFVIDAG